MSKSNLYTKKGDSGKTSLVGGQRVAKSELRIALYGTFDELNSFVGVAISSKKAEQAKAFDYLDRIQVLLFNLGSNVACVKEDREKFKLPSVSLEDLNEIESLIDEVDSSLPKLKKFIMPRGCSLASNLHVCRTVTRRVERLAFEFNESTNDELEENILKYLNRLSDYFFALARLANQENGIQEVEW